MQADKKNRQSRSVRRRFGLVTGLTLALAGSAAALGSAHAGPKDFIIFTPGLGGDPDVAKPYIDKFAVFLEGAMGWPKGSTHGTFLTSRKEALAAIDSKKPGFGVMEASLYMELRKTNKAQVLAQVESPDLNSPKLHVVVKDPLFKSLADLNGKRFWTTMADSVKYLGNVVLDGKGSPEARFQLKQIGVYSKGVRAVLRGEADATLVNDEQLAAAKKMEGGGDLRSIYDSPALPPLVVVSLDGALPAADAQKLSKTLQGMCGGAGGEVCTEMHINKFVPTNASALTAAQQRYEKP
jgi:ABC-type phosphate/phosphonate transport system substrate-binding protein